MAEQSWQYYAILAMPIPSWDFTLQRAQTFLVMSGMSVRKSYRLWFREKLGTHTREEVNTMYEVQRCVLIYCDCLCEWFAFGWHVNVKTPHHPRVLIHVDDVSLCMCHKRPDLI